jgi:NAD+ kinase
LFLACFHSTGKSCIEHQADLDDVKTNNLAKQPTLYNGETNGQSEECCSSNGICSHEVLRDGKPDSDSKMVRKVFYKLLIEEKYVIMIILLQQDFLLIL